MFVHNRYNTTYTVSGYAKHTNELIRDLCNIMPFCVVSIAASCQIYSIIFNFLHIPSSHKIASIVFMILEYFCNRACIQLINNNFCVLILNEKLAIEAIFFITKYYYKLGTYFAFGWEC